MPTLVCQTCCECGNCVRCCPRQAITLERDAFGNCHAVIDERLCVDCGLCSKRCPMQQPAPCAQPVQAYAAVSAAPEASNSTSGGMFFELANGVLSDGGLVVGAAYDGEWNIRHIPVRDHKDLALLQGSKYVRSDASAAIPLVRDALIAGTPVLFCGTPCQVAALELEIREPELRQRLITVDLICHGTPPARIFRDYLAHLEQKHRGTLTAFRFRDKGYGNKLIGSYSIRKGGQEKKHPLFPAESAYYHLFLNGLTYTHSCYTCPYAQGQRCSDITIGDFWGWAQEIPSFAASRGLPADTSVSAVMVNSARGAALFERLLPHLLACPVSYESIQKHNDQLRGPVHVPASLRKRVAEAYGAEGFAGLMGIHREMTDLRRYTLRITSMLPTGLKETIKKLLRRGGGV